MAHVIHLAAYTVQDRHPATKKVIIQSDNASVFASKELIPFILNMNTILDDENNYVEQMDIHINTDRKDTIGYSLFISK